MIAITDQRSGRGLLLPALDADVAMQPLLPDASVGPLRVPLGLCVHASRYVAIADSGNGRIVVFDAASSTWSSFGAGTLASPRAVVPDGAGGLLVADTARVVRVVDQTGAAPSDVLPPADGSLPLAVAARNGTDIDVATADGRLRRTTDGGATWTDIALDGPSPARPVALARTATGATYVCDLGNARVLAVADDGSVTTALDERHGVVLPTAVAVADRDLFVVDTGANRIRRFALHDDRIEPAEYVNGRRPDGTFRFDRVGGITLGSF